MHLMLRNGFIRRTRLEASAAFQLALRLALGSGKRRAALRAELTRRRAERSASAFTTQLLAMPDDNITVESNLDNDGTLRQTVTIKRPHPVELVQTTVKVRT